MLNHSQYLVKERVGLLKLVDTFDIFDPATGRQIGIAKETPTTLVHILRFLMNKQFLPTMVVIKESEESAPVLTIRRGFTFLRSKIMVEDANGTALGYFKSKIMSLGGGFHVYDTSDSKVADVKGDWKGWNFTMTSTAGKQLGTVSKKWAGIGRELFTSADNYMIAISEELRGNQGIMALLLAAGLAIDIVFKEK